MIVGCRSIFDIFIVVPSLNLCELHDVVASRVQISKTRIYRCGKKPSPAYSPFDYAQNEVFDAFWLNTYLVQIVLIGTTVSPSMTS